MVKETKKETTKKYFEATGGRKTASARVRIYVGESGFTVNGVDYKKYFKTQRQIEQANMPIAKWGSKDKIKISAKVTGSGLPSQAEAVSLGVSRALIKMDPIIRPILKPFGLLTRDPRMVERKKYGLKKARRAPQWAKR